jgi:stress-induced morphogen
VKEIVIDVSDDGEVKIETRGFVGKSCIKESQFLKDLLGKEMSQQLIPAYYVTGKEKTSVKKHLPLCG